MEAGLGYHQAAFPLRRMTADPIWPAGPAELVLWAQIISVWLIATYAIAPNYIPERGRIEGTGKKVAKLVVACAVAGSLGWLLPPAGTDALTRVLLLATLVVFGLGPALIRRLTSVRGGNSFLAEFEIGANICVLAVSASVIGLGGIGWTASDSIVQSGKVTAIACAIAAIVAVFRCGTYVVRGVLNRAGALPGQEPEAASDSGSFASTTELSRGRSIGNLERLLMIVAIGVGRYEVLGFLVAAKGLIRSRDFENRGFAEYFILGTLASTAVALVVGLALSASVRYFWRLEG